ncbi:uncharacterized protein MYCGRDRAFT_81913 [Zymoseptoria tritici IPO323]|uniref:Uncharacterized protein n=1 Tax=Zymoseptoria tritici (strain CBS 115943 / IPO323) TaxID=336722 RepID=F9XI90_ZYMTI|nr:uncharacterized protein MYCGRDRAFT_81913 [Zymoseptoria tritici IPO323]EGP85055.1 hypothetical protein MYCGRDRAFT_81913 [Zymoseptoria tritici IPO323]
MASESGQAQMSELIANISPVFESQIYVLCYEANLLCFVLIGLRECDEDTVHTLPVPAQVFVPQGLLRGTNRIQKLVVFVEL